MARRCTSLMASTGRLAKTLASTEWPSSKFSDPRRHGIITRVGVHHNVCQSDIERTPPALSSTQARINSSHFFLCCTKSVSGLEPLFLWISRNVSSTLLRCLTAGRRRGKREEGRTLLFLVKLQVQCVTDPQIQCVHLCSEFFCC